MRGIRAVPLAKTRSFYTGQVGLLKNYTLQFYETFIPKLVDVKMLEHWLLYTAADPSCCVHMLFVL